MAGVTKEFGFEETDRQEPSLSLPDGPPAAKPGTDDDLIQEIESLTRNLRTDYRPPRNEEPSAAGKILYLSLGVFCVAIGGIGILIPVLPTTVFMIVALWAFTRSSPRMRDWLYHHRLFGPVLQDWVQHRSIPTRARQIALASLLTSALFIGYMFGGLACLAFILFVCVPVASFLWTLPVSSKH